MKKRKNETARKLKKESAGERERSEGFFVFLHFFFAVFSRTYLRENADQCLVILFYSSSLFFSFIVFFFFFKFRSRSDLLPFTENRARV